MPFPHDMQTKGTMYYTHSVRRTSANLLVSLYESVGVFVAALMLCAWVVRNRHRLSYIQFLMQQVAWLDCFVCIVQGVETFCLGTLLPGIISPGDIFATLGIPQTTTLNAIRHQKCTEDRDPNIATSIATATATATVTGTITVTVTVCDSLLQSRALEGPNTQNFARENFAAFVNGKNFPQKNLPCKIFPSLAPLHCSQRQTTMSDC